MRLNRYRFMTQQRKDEIILLDTPKGQISCRVIRCRRKSYGALVKDGQVQLRIPLRGSVEKARELADEWQDWIVKKLSQQQDRAKEKQALLEESRNRFTPGQREYLEKKYRAAAKEYIPGRAKHYADILGVTFEKIRIAEQKTRWGSCSAKGTLSFNWKLMLAPPGVLDYVIVHEVCHLKEMNHSPRFWQWVGFLMPDYGEQRKWLKEHGEQLQYY